ncbi:hypothetical protein BDV12DRAFT_189718 [Aspergillus spectabilis]
MPEIVGKQIGPTPPPQEQAFATLRAAIANGLPRVAEKVVLSIKGGVNPETHQLDASPENTRRTLDDCIAQLKGRKKFDMFEFGRRDPNVPLEVAFGVIDKEYVQTGKIGGIALSEVRGETIHEAVKYTKIVAVEAELSMFTPDILDNGVAAACAQYGIPIVAYSPIGRGMLTGQLKKYSDLPKDSLLLQFDFPRFQQENFENNLQLVSKVEEIAAKKGCTPAQLAISWTIALSRRLKTMIVPIPGSSTPERVEENSKIVEVSDEELDQIDAILKIFTPAGDSHPPIFQTNT